MVAFSLLDPLSTPQQLALLAMRRSDLSAVLAKLAQAGTARAPGRCFYELAQLGLAVRSPRGTFHILSPRGRYEADRVGREIARQFGLHVISYDLGGPGRAACARCPCGWAAFRTRAIGSYLISLTRDAAFHMARVAGEAAQPSVPISSVALRGPASAAAMPTQRGDHDDDPKHRVLPALPQADEAGIERTARHAG